MTVSELDARMTSREFAEWMIYFQIEPFGPARQDYHAALISTVVANSSGNKMSPNDFIKPFEVVNRVPEVIDEDEFSAKQLQMMSIFKAMP
tara:strand:+ start:376 stop:648 length:273 start_codon:yes stop_codon:yes gene_type:complete